MGHSNKLKVSEFPVGAVSPRLRLGPWPLLNAGTVCVAPPVALQDVPTEQIPDPKRVQSDPTWHNDSSHVWTLPSNACCQSFVRVEMYRLTIAPLLIDRKTKTLDPPRPGPE